MDFFVRISRLCESEPYIHTNATFTESDIPVPVQHKSTCTAYTNKLYESAHMLLACLPTMLCCVVWTFSRPSNEKTRKTTWTLPSQRVLASHVIANGLTPLHTHTHTRTHIRQIQAAHLFNWCMCAWSNAQARRRWGEWRHFRRHFGEILCRLTITNGTTPMALCSAQTEYDGAMKLSFSWHRVGRIPSYKKGFLVESRARDEKNDASCIMQTRHMTMAIMTTVHCEYVERWPKSYAHELVASFEGK